MLTDLSIIIATYNEDPRNLSLMVSTLASVLEPTALCYEIIFVNDGSRATTTQALRDLALKQAHVKVIELSRNFGQQAAITCGLDYSQGRAVVNLDSDLQDPPELIPEMIKKWQEGFDVVYAQRYTRKDSVFKRITAFLFYRLLGAVSTVKIPVDSGDFRLMDRKVVKALASLPEKTRFIRGMVPWLGFKQIGIPIDRRAREVGESTYTFKKMVSLALDGLLAFSSAPLFLVSAVGIFLTLLSGLALLLTLTVCAGNQILLVLEFLGFFTGLQITCMGIIALYLARVLDEARARPIYLVSEIIEKKFSEEKT
jgi:dolichol-phosphate mannosyltransferase